MELSSQRNNRRCSLTERTVRDIKDLSDFQWGGKEGSFFLFFFFRPLSAELHGDNNKGKCSNKAVLRRHHLLLRRKYSNNYISLPFAQQHNRHSKGPVLYPTSSLMLIYENTGSTGTCNMALSPPSQTLLFWVGDIYRRSGYVKKLELFSELHGNKAQNIG